MTAQNANAIEFQPSDDSINGFIIARAVDFAEARRNAEILKPEKYWHIIAYLDTPETKIGTYLQMRTPRQYDPILRSKAMEPVLTGWDCRKNAKYTLHTTTVPGLLDDALIVIHNMADKFFATEKAQEKAQQTQSRAFAETFRAAWDKHDWSLA